MNRAIGKTKQHQRKPQNYTDWFYFQFTSKKTFSTGNPTICYYINQFAFLFSKMINFPYPLFSKLQKLQNCLF